MVTKNMEKIIIYLSTHVKQFVIVSADPGKLLHNIVQYHRHLYSSDDHYGYMFRMFVSRTEVCDDRLSFNRNVFVNCAYTQLLRWYFFSCDHTFFIRIYI